jgi:hypothetical protein
VLFEQVEELGLGDEGAVHEQAGELGSARPAVGLRLGQSLGAHQAPAREARGELILDEVRRREDEGALLQAEHALELAARGGDDAARGTPRTGPQAVSQHMVRRVEAAHGVSRSRTVRAQSRHRRA